MSLLPLVLSMASGQVLTPPPMPREFRAVWVATVDNIDWPSKRNLSSSEQRAEMIHILDIAKSMNLNAVVLQVRPSADALYRSKLEPWSEYLTGRQGQGPKPAYDPLEFAVTEAHRRGLELHAWFNPYRALHPAQKGPLASNHIAKTNSAIVKQYGKYLWMDPGEPEVQKRSLQVMLDVVKRYDIDGVHMDDYFYPYKEKGSDGKYIDFPDGPSYHRYLASGGSLDKEDWRRKNVDDFVRDLYDGIKKEKRWVKFGISPFGIWRPGYPSTIQGYDQYAMLYADARKWLREGWCDYFTPQLYWAISQKAQSYPVLLQWWADQNVQHRHLWPGNYTSKTMPSEGNWKPGEILNQISITRQLPDPGNVHFSMKPFLINSNGITDALRNGPYAQPAIVPASPWLDDQAPNAPKVSVRTEGDRKWTVTWTPDGDNDIRFYETSVQVGTKWLPPTVSSDANLTVETTRGIPSRVSVVAVDRAGNESKPTVVDLDIVSNR